MGFKRRLQISSRLGGQTVLRSLAPATLAGSIYLTIGSTSETTPGVVFDGLDVPLAPDAYTEFTFSSPNNALLSGSLGTLDVRGVADSVFQLPPIPGGLPIPITFHHATLVLGPPGLLQAVTDAVGLTVLSE